MAHKIEAHQNMEEIVDIHGIDEALRILAQVCSDKAEHLATNWQSPNEAKKWEKRMMQIDLLANRV